MKKEMALSALNKHWVLKTSDDRQVQALCQHFELPEIVARVLVGRHIAFDHVADFLKPTLRKNLPDPFHLRDMDKAISRIVQAIENHESIMLLGDYDVDGATSTSLMYTYLKDIGACVSFYIPDRMIDGYGPSVKAMETFAREKVNLVITLDCGTTAFEPLSYAKTLGLDVIVIDHHVAENKLPDAVAVVNPNRLDETSPLKHVAAVGLAFMVSVALNSHLKKCGFFDNKLAPDLLYLLDLVALGTVCDVMPLQGLNRAFVAQGLKVMANRKNKGLKALADKAGLTEKPTPYHLGYLLGPRINAGGRVGDATLGTRLLITSDTLDAEKIATELNHYNSQRQALEAQALDEAKDQAHQQKDSVIVVVGPWHPGIVGIIAGRLKDMYHRPVFCLSLDKGIAKGSGRSITGFDLGFFVHKARELGHITAGGGGMPWLRV